MGRRHRLDLELCIWPEVKTHEQVLDVLDILDNSILADAAEIEADTGIRPSVKSCLWDRMNACLRCFAEHLTLSDFLDLQKEEAASGDFYSI